MAAFCAPARSQMSDAAARELAGRLGRRRGSRACSGTRRTRRVRAVLFEVLGDPRVGLERGDAHVLGRAERLVLVDHELGARGEQHRLATRHRQLHRALDHLERAHDGCGGASDRELRAAHRCDRDRRVDRVGVLVARERTHAVPCLALVEAGAHDVAVLDVDELGHRHAGVGLDALPRAVEERDLSEARGIGLYLVALREVALFGHGLGRRGLTRADRHLRVERSDRCQHTGAVGRRCIIGSRLTTAATARAQQQGDRQQPTLGLHSHGPTLPRSRVVAQ